VSGAHAAHAAAVAARAPHTAPAAGIVAARPAACKVAVAFVWVVAVAATPARAVWAFALHAAVVAVVVRLAAVPARVLLRRLALDVPFVVFALALPFLGPAPRTELIGVPLSTTGLVAMWAILAKATLGLVVAVLLGATTPVTDLLRGLQQLRVPRLLVAIAGLMVRYLVVLGDDLERMRVARIARGADPRRLRQAPAVAAGAGTTFVRAYERGERVHLAMASRGFTGRLPDLGGDAPTGREWFVTALPALAAATITAAALVVR
jgi:cobalt/nickel transport system permease protein